MSRMHSIVSPKSAKWPRDSQFQPTSCWTFTVEMHCGNRKHTSTHWRCAFHLSNFSHFIMALPWRYYVTFILGIFEMMFFGGITFGWASLVYILKSDGYFSYLCFHQNETNFVGFEENQTSLSCDDQDANLNLVFTIAVFAYQGCMFFCGFLFDKHGTRYTRLLLQ